VVAVYAILGADGVEPLPPGPEPLSPRDSRLRSLARQYAYCDKLCASRCVDCLSSSRKPRGLAIVPLRPRHQREPLWCPVRYLCPTGTTRFAPGGRSAGLDRFLAPARHHRPYGVLFSAVPHWTIAEQALEMVGLADCDFCRSGSDHLCVVSRSANGCSWPDPKPGRDRRLHQRLQSHGVRHISCSDWRSGLSSVTATAPGHRSGAPADQVVCLRCCGELCRHHPYVHHPRSDRDTTLVRAGGIRTQHSHDTSHSCRYRDSHPAL